MSKPSTLRAVTRPPVDLTDRSYWAGTIKVALSKFFVLRVLHDGPSHGYDIARAVERITSGCCSPSEGGLYPVLRELEQGGYAIATAEVVSGRERKVYELTDKGRQAFRVGAEAWLDATEVVIATKRVASKRQAACKC
jgi:PadR family transcriptional regulator, regulatory protein PadR